MATNLVEINSLKQFLGRLLLFIVPLIVIVIAYFLLDPFKVIYSYRDYYNNLIIPNRDFVSTEVFLKNNSKQHYNAFIFGSSRTIAYDPDIWKNTIGDSLLRVYKFDASSENIAGILRKMQLIENKGDTIKQALIILGTDASFVKDSVSARHLLIPHPVYSKSNLVFQWSFINAYLSKGYFIRIIDYLIFKNYRPYMKGYINFYKLQWNSTTNNLYNTREDSILLDSLAYYKKYKYNFYNEDSIEEQEAVRQIDQKDKEILQKIAKILKQNHSSYKIVVSPLFDKKRMNSADMEILIQVFGANHIYDYSGVNNITTNKYNYYERSHYRLRVGTKIIKEIYFSKHH